MIRGPRKVTVDYGRADVFKSFKKDENTPDLDRSTHSKVLNEFNKEVSRLILEEAFEFLLPARVGTLRIKKYKPKIFNKDGSLKKDKLNPNWKKTNELWNKDPEAKAQKKLVYHTNEHSDGYEYKWHFSNYRSMCENKSAYCFIPTRTNKRAITALVTDEEFTGDYFM
jgi:hypothetical protein